MSVNNADDNASDHGECNGNDDDASEHGEGNDDENQQNVNPALSDDDEEQLLDVIRQDAIGDTMYSAHFVIKVLVRLTQLEKSLQEDAELEKDLCTLWDMSTDAEVVDYLRNQQVIEICTICIQNSEDNRLVEILVGILGNMCFSQETCQAIALNNNTVSLILALTASDDSLVLIQVMRCISMAFIDIDLELSLKWYKQICIMPNCVQNFVFILYNSLNHELLGYTLEALNGMLAKFTILDLDALGDAEATDLKSFGQVFVRPDLVESILIAIQTLIPEVQHADAYNMIENDTSETVKKTIQVVLNLHCILVQHGEISRICYVRIENELIKWIRNVLEPLVNPLILFPICVFERNVIECINTIMECLGDVFDEIISSHLFTIWKCAAEHVESIRRAACERSTSESSDDCAECSSNMEQLGEEICNQAIDCLARAILKAPNVELKNMLKRHPPKDVAHLMMELRTAENVPATYKECCQKIQVLFDL